MEQNRRKNRRGKTAFTLAEFLAVIAIVSILASISFVAVIRYQRQLRRMEMDQTAKEIFLAAQNHLSLEVSDGTIPRLLNMKDDSTEEDVESKLGRQVTVTRTESDGTAKKEELYAILYQPEQDGEDGTEINSVNTTEEIRGRLLPFGSIDETVRQDGSYLIFYDPEEGLVREVWYSDRYHFVKDDIGSTALMEAAASAKKRERFVGANTEFQDKRLPIGHYASGTLEQPDVGPVVKLQAPTVELKNEDILYAVITDPNTEEHTLRFFIEGQTSGAEAYLDVTETQNRIKQENGSYYIILDDIAAKAYNFASLNEDAGLTFKKNERNFEVKFIPGEDIRVYARVFSNAELSKVEGEEVVKTGNSLFSSISGDTANRAWGVTIKSMRHLENLDERFSGFVPKNVFAGMTDADVLTAMQGDDLAWKTFSGVNGVTYDCYLGQVAALHSGYRSLEKSRSKIQVFYQEADGQWKNSDITCYVSVRPQYALDYQGNGRFLRGLNQSRLYNPDYIYISGNGGMFSSVSWDLSVRDLIMWMPKITVQDTAGVLVGTAETDLETTRKPTVSIENVQVQYAIVENEAENASVGGLVGSFEGKELNITKVLTEEHFRDRLDGTEGGADLYATDAGMYKLRAKGKNGVAGGLVGSATGGVHISYSAAAMFVDADGMAGGLIGTVHRPAGGSASEYPVEIYGCYVGGHTARNFFWKTQPQDTQTFNDQPGRFNVISRKGRAGGLAAKLPKDSVVTYTFVSASVYTNIPSTLSEQEMVKQERASGFIALYEDGTNEAAGTLIPDVNSTYKGCYSCGIVNKTGGTPDSDGNIPTRPVLLYDKLLKEIFKKEVTVKTQAYPYETTLGKEYPMPSVEGLLKKYSENVEGLNLPWYIEGYVGDWEMVSEETDEEVGLGGDNRLHADYVYKEELEKGKQYYLIFSVTGSISQNPVYYIVTWKEGEAGSAKYLTTDNSDDIDTWVNPDHLQWNNWIPVDDSQSGTKGQSRDRFEFTYTPEGFLKVTFYMDNLAYKDANYKNLGQGFVNGEDVIVKACEDEWKENEPDYTSDPMNSLFERVEKNTDGSDTYTAYIASYRNLMNLGLCASTASEGNGIHVTRAVQTDNLLWTEDESLESNIEPYLKEMQEAYPGEPLISYMGSTDFKGGVLPIKNPYLKSYDGGGFTIAGLNIVTQNVGNFWGATALFVNTNSEFTVTNLSLKDPVIQGDGNATALLVANLNEGSTAKKTSLTIENVNVYGDAVQIKGAGSTGGLAVDLSASEINLKNIQFQSPNGVISGNVVGGMVNAITAGKKLEMENIQMKGDSLQITTTGGAAGGIVGTLTAPNADVKIQQVSLTGDNLRIEGNSAAGLVGEIEADTLSMKDILVQGDSASVIGSSWNAAGISIKLKAKTASPMSNIYFYGKDALVQGSNVGGLFTEAEVTEQITLDNSFFSGYAYGTAGWPGYAGGLFGQLTIGGTGGPSYVGSSIKNSYVGGRNHSYGSAESVEGIGARKTVMAQNKVGGLIADGKGPLTVTQCFSAADVYGINYDSRVGGLFGAYDGRNTSGLYVDGCYLAGTIKSEQSSNYTGTFIGQLNGTTPWGDQKISNCFIKNSLYLNINGAYTDKIFGSPTWTPADAKDQVASADSQATSPLMPSVGEECEITITSNPSLTGNYPFKLWTTGPVWRNDHYEYGRLYVGDWVMQ